MNRISVSLAFSAIFFAGTVSAQSETPAYKRGYVSDQNAAVESTRNAFGSTAEFLQTTGKSDGEDVVKIKGAYYMPLYGTNLYKGDDANRLRAACQKLFASRYPKAVMKSSALPQTAWLTEENVKGDKTVGYTQTMYCYIVAEDGTGGYINARFAYKRYKDEGGKYAPLSDYWPKWERTDFPTAAVYEKLKKK